MVLPDSHVSSTSSTRLPVTRRGGPAITDPSGVMAIEAKSRCRMLATTAPGITPAFAIPMTTSGSYSRNTLRASTRHSSPKNAQSTWSTPRGVLLVGRDPALARGVGRGERGGRVIGDSTLPASAAASYFRPMGFWRRLFGGSSGGGGGDVLKPQRSLFPRGAWAWGGRGGLAAALRACRLGGGDPPHTRPRLHTRPLER